MFKKKKEDNGELHSVAHRGGRLEPFSSHLTSYRAQMVYSSANIYICACVCFTGTKFAFILLYPLALSLYIIC